MLRCGMMGGWWGGAAVPRPGLPLQLVPTAVGARLSPLSASLYNTNHPTGVQQAALRHKLNAATHSSPLCAASNLYY